MIVLLGASGYIGQAFADELGRRKIPFEAHSRKKLNYASFPVLHAYLQQHKPEFLINAGGYTGKPNVDACETARADTLAGNTLLPLTIAQACEAAGVPWGHVSSGCIYSGAKVTEGGQTHVEKDLTQPRFHALLAKSPESFHGFTETDEPNFSFRSPPCSFYSGAKALGEEAISGLGRNYLWRLRIPFDEVDNGRNYLSKVQRYTKVYDNVNSISHRGDFVNACLDLWDKKAPFGAYNITNPGFITTRHVIELIQKILRPNRSFEFWVDDEDFYSHAATTPRSNCVMDVSKLLAAGVKIRPVEQALTDALKSWKAETPSK